MDPRRGSWTAHHPASRTALRRPRHTPGGPARLRTRRCITNHRTRTLPSRQARVLLFCNFLGAAAPDRQTSAEPTSERHRRDQAPCRRHRTVRSKSPYWTLRRKELHTQKSKRTESVGQNSISRRHWKWHYEIRTSKEAALDHRPRARGSVGIVGTHSETTGG